MRVFRIMVGLGLAFHVTAVTAETSQRHRWKRQQEDAEQPTHQAAPRGQAASESTSTPSGDTQSCHAENNILFVTYSVLIRIPYAGKDDCDATHKALQDVTNSITGFECKRDIKGYIYLSFNTANWFYALDINNALESRYPSVDEFNCPDN